MVGAWNLVRAAAAATLAAVALSSGPRGAAETADPARAVMAAAKAATGGAAWDRITGWHERGRHDGATYDTLLDFRRWAFRFATTRDGKTRVNGFDGSLVWRQGPDGKVTTKRDAASLADARLSAYGSTFAFLRPARFPARFQYLGVRTDGAASFDVVRVTPEGTTPMEVWVDRKTHLFARLVDRSGPKPVTARLSDFRPVGGIRQPFRLEISDGDPAHAQIGVVESVVLEPVARGAFDPPPSR